MLCENPKTNVAAINSRKSRGKFKNLFVKLQFRKRSNLKVIFDAAELVS